MVRRALVVIVASLSLAACSQHAVMPTPVGNTPSTFGQQIDGDAVIGFTQHSLATTIGYALAVGHDGNFYSYQSGEMPDIVRIDTSGNETFIPMSGHAFGPGEMLTPNPDGNIYALEEMPDNSFDVAQVTQAGTVTEFPLPISDSPGGIITGSDGNLWIMHSGGVGRLTTSGQYTEFSGGPYDVGLTLRPARGSDKNVWFTAISNNANVLVRVSVGDGSQQVFPLPDDASALTQATDGNLYCIGNGVIYSISTSGTVTSFVVPKATRTAIIAAGMGRLWWAKFGHVYGWNIKTHKMETNVVAPFSWANILTFGPDKNLWLTQGNPLYVLMFS